VSVSPELQIDVLIFGGGIAGLWTLARLRKEGYSCLLLESKALGAGQTIASQGIIHGGIKYALTGQASAASKAIAAMPAIWRACLEGTGEIDLRGVKVLSERQYLWTTGGIGSRIAGFAASKVIRTAVDRVTPEQRPDWLQSAPRGVDVYGVDEPILDPHSVLERLATLNAECIGRVALCERGSPMTIQENGEIVGSWAPARLPDDLYGQASHDIAIRARRTIFCAGEANQAYMRLTRGETQVRPLHMVMAKAQHYRPNLPSIYGHCVGLSDKPKLTITSQLDVDRRVVWYVGGDIAERGVDLSPIELIAATRLEVSECLPWIDISGTQWATLRVNRAEGVGSGSRPDEPIVLDSPRGIGVWPTKLAFAPLAASRVVDALRSTGIEPSGENAAFMSATQFLVRPSIAMLPWHATGVRWT
jgi:glycerol-3-phosphate dehydrogenase